MGHQSEIKRCSPSDLKTGSFHYLVTSWIDVMITINSLTSMGKVIPIDCWSLVRIYNVQALGISQTDG